jgi:hypothetical protein
LFIPYVALVGQCVASVHWTHWDAGSIAIPVGRRSQTLSVISSAQSLLFKHPTQRLLGASQTLLPVGFAVHPFMTVPQGVRPSATPASLVLPALPADPPDPPAPPVAVPPVPVEPAVPVVAPPVPAPVVVLGGASSPPQAI